MPASTPPPPVLIDGVLDDPDLIRRLAEAHEPYLPTQRYFANSAEYEALSGADDVDEMPVAPLFRGDWASGGTASAGVEPLLHHRPFVDAAKELFDGAVVRPRIVYANLTHQLPFTQGGGHTDIPAFRGFDRSDHPITFLSIMGQSGLFEDVRVRIATAVAWFYEGDDGGFEYWPDGPEAPSVVHEGDIHNTAIVADNDVMFHRALGVGDPADGMVEGMSLESRLQLDDGGGWEIRDDGRTLARPSFDELRISVSWKGLVFDDRDRAEAHDAGEGGIDLEEVLGRFEADLRSRGVGVTVPVDTPTRDPGFIRTLRDVYVREPEAELV